MKYKAIAMVPKVVEFECDGDNTQISNTAWACLGGFDVVILPSMEFGPILAAVIPEGVEPTDNPLVFDPPPMAA